MRDRTQNLHGMVPMMMTSHARLMLREERCRSEGQKGSGCRYSSLTIVSWLLRSVAMWCGLALEVAKWDH